MRKIYISILAFFAVFTASAQYTPMTGFGYQFKRIVVDSTLQIPSFCGVPTLRNSTLKNGGIAIDTCNNKLYKYTRSNGWSEVGGGAGGNFIDSLKRSNDSIFARKNGVWTFQYKDSIGGGGGSQNLQQVTDQGATTTNTITIDDGSRAMAIYEKNISTLDYNLLRYYDGLSGNLLTLYDSSTASSGGIKYKDINNDRSFELSVNSYDGYKLNLDNGDYSFDIVENKIEVNSNNTFETIIPVTNSSGLHDTTYFPVNDATKDTIATLRNVRNNPVGLGSVYDTAGVILARVRNSEATTLQRGEVVYIYGSTGNTASVKRANNKQDSTSSKTFGLVRNPIVAGDTGIIVTQGQIDKLNLGAYNEGDILWLDSVSGQFTKNKPVAPYHQVFLGVVERANNGNGLAYIKVQNGYELNELHNVSLNGVANNQVLMYESSTQLWKNKSVYTAVDTTSLSNRINTKLNISDTSGMLTNYAKNSQVNVKLNISDTATMLTPYLRKLDTASLSNRINTKLNISDTTVFDRKSAAAYTFRANGTNATANMTDFTFRDTSGVYTGSILWNGTAPSGATNHYYQWQQIGKMVKLQIVLSYATVGSATSQVTMALPSDCPAPALPAFNAGASSILYQGFGLIALNTTSTTAFASGGAGLRRNAADNGNELFINFASTGPRVARIEVTYRAQ